MSFRLTALALIQLFGAAIAFALAAYAYRRRDRPGAGWIAIVLFGDAVWMLTAGVNYATTDLGVSRAMLQLRYLGIPVVIVALLFFAIEYTGARDWLTTRRKALIALPAAAATVLALTDGVHGLFYESVTPATNPQGVAFEYGLAAVPWVAYAFVLTVLAVVVLVRYGLVTDRVYRWQAFGVAGAVALTILTDLLYFLPVPPNEFTVTPLAILFASAFVIVLIYRTEFLALVPATREFGRRELIDTMDLGMIVVDPDGTVVDVNPAAADPLGVTPREALGESLATLLPALADAEPGSRLERSFSVDGVTREYEVRTDDVGAGSDALLVTLQDVTNRTRQQRRIDVLQRVLRHNIRTEMQLVVSGASTIERDADDDALREQATAIREAAEDVVTISDVTRRIEGHLDDDRETTTAVDACGAAREAVASYRQSAPAATFEVTCRGDGDALAGDALVTVLETLVENAIEHNDAEEPTVTVRVAPDPDDPAEWLAVAVADDGPGIPPEERAILTGEEEITPLRHGSGLGLWQAVWLVEAWGGSVEIADNDPRGTIVTCRLRRP